MKRLQPSRSLSNQNGLRSELGPKEGEAESEEKGMIQEGRVKSGVERRGSGKLRRRKN